MKRLLTLTVVAALAAFGTAAKADFSGYYAPGNWTTDELGSGVGFVDTSGAPASVTLIGGDDGFDADTYWTINSAAAGTVSFDWSYSSFDDPGYDGGFYVVTDLSNWIFLSTTDGETGSISFDVAAGELFGFNIYSEDGLFGAGALTITNFSAPVPEPTSLALLGIGAIGLVARRRR